LTEADIHGRRPTVAAVMSVELQLPPSRDRARAFEGEMRRRHEYILLELDHDAWELRDLIVTHGGVGAARRLLDSRSVSPTFRLLRRRGRLDLTVESLALDARWSSLFSDGQLVRAAERLMRAGLRPPNTAA